jgi:hypothetical protein
MTNIVKYDKKSGTLQISEYVTINSMLVLRECLADDHPRSYYQTIKNLGLKPEDFGVYYRHEYRDGILHDICPCCGSSKPERIS